MAKNVIEGSVKLRGCPNAASLLVSFAIAAMLFALSQPVWAETVFVVDSYHAAYPWSSECRGGLQEELLHGIDVQFFEMDTKRYPDSRFAERAEAAWKACIRAHPDLVVLMDDNALRFLGKRMSDAGFPVVFMGINGNPRRYFSAHSIPYNVSGVLERPLLMRSVKYLGEFLQAPAKRFLVMMDDAYTSDAIIESSLGGRRDRLVSGIEVETFLTGDFGAWKRRVHRVGAGNYDAVILGSYAALEDDDGNQVPLDDVTVWTAANCRVPVFSFWHFSVGKGKAIGGLLISGVEQGKAAARIVNRYLTSGEMPALDIPAKGALVFSEHELARWGITLPVRIRLRSTFID